MNTGRVQALAFSAVSMIPHAYRLVAAPPSFYHDDVFYYFKTAHNIAAGVGSSFDGINLTNGYHPLWMAVCTAFALVVHDPATYCAVMLSVNLLFVFLFSVTLFGMFRENLGPRFAGFLLILVNGNLLTGLNLFSGLETPLELWLLLLCVQRCADLSEKDGRKSIVLGCLMGAAFLARTSFALFLPVFLVFAFASGTLKTARSCRFVLPRLFIPFCVITVPYLAWNYSLTGHFQQISGLVKELYPSGSSMSANFLFLAKELPKSVLLRPLWVNILTAAWLVLFGITVLRDRRVLAGFRDPRLLLLAAYSALLLLYYGIKFSEHAAAWHFMTPWVTVQVLFVHALSAAWNGVVRNTRGAVIAIVVPAIMAVNYLAQVPLYVYRGLTLHPYFVSSIDYSRALSDWIRDNVPAGAKVGAFNAGYFGFYSGRTVVNLDGLINGMELYQYLKDGRGAWQYAVDKKLDYVADCFFGTPPQLSKDLADHFQLVHRVGKTDVRHGSQPTYIDGYVWRVKP